MHTININEKINLTVIFMNINISIIHYEQTLTDNNKKNNGNIITSKAY